MTRFQKIMSGIYAALYLAGLTVVWMDVYVWRAEEPKPSGAQIQAAQQAKAFYK
jgi:hypothetical protein